jgi:PKHD-type hydroxylase
MMIAIPDVLTPQQVSDVRARLDTADDAWVDGRVTAGHQGARVKHNRQIAEGSTVARELGDVVLGALERNPLFISATLPHSVYPPMFNHYEGGMQFGGHVDGAVRLVPGSGAKMRTDLSATLFLSRPEDYDGGELLVEDTYGGQSVKLSAGHMIVYPAGSVHGVRPVTRGARVACILWVQSLVRDDGQRSILFDFDTAIQRLAATGGDEAARVQLTGCYHNLLRMWTQT